MRRFAVLAALVALALVMGIFPAATAQAQSVVWTGQYYNNAYLLDPPTFTRSDSAIAFNWGLGSPGPGINVDGFSVRWATDVVLQPGTYRFFAQADDDVRVTFNFNQTVINTFDTTNVGQLVSGDVTVPSAGTYHIQVDYRERSDTAFAFVSFNNLATNPTAPTFPVNPGTVSGQWVAFYYPNVNLAGDAAAILTVNTPNFNTGGAQPVPSVPASNWSARFTSVQTLTPGNYQATFNVDDGFRYIVNGATLIDQMGSATGQTQTVGFTVTSGQTTFQIDFVQFGGNAYLQYTLNQTGGGQTVIPPVTGGPFATAQVRAGRLNVRAAPSATAEVLTKVSFGESYPVFGRSSDNRWLLIDVNGTRGWASSGYMRVDTPNNVPVVDGSGPVATSAPVNPNGPFTATATPYNVVVRSGPSTTASRLTAMPVGTTVQIVGRTADSTWWQVNFNGIVGWSSAQYAVIQQNANINAIPVTG